nr:T9SS type A sorting domain-containing protein [Bacteroidales bacterium]
YRWYHGLNNDMEAHITTNNLYRVKIPRNQLMPYYRCEMESQTGVPFVFEIRTYLPEITADFSVAQQDSDQMTVFRFADLSVFRKITPGFSAGPIFVPSDTVVVPANNLRWSWKNEGSAWTLFAQNDHNPTLSLPTPDHYDSIRVKLEVEDPETGQRDWVEKTLYFGNNVGISSYAGDVTLYPNPNGGKFSVRSGSARMREVRVYDLQGRLLRDLAVDGQTTDINIENFPAGTYLVHILTDKGSVTKTVLKQ